MGLHFISLSYCCITLENWYKKQLNSLVENLSEEALAQLREEAESLHQQEKSPVENPFEIF
jgi:hypothetical protein